MTLSYVDNAKEDIEQGLTYNSLSTGEFKDTGNPNKPLTADEKAYLEVSLQQTLQDFIQTVSTNRNLPLAKVTALADGSSMLGEDALKNGLIDELGTNKEVMDKLQQDIKTKPEVCWPQYQ